MKNHKLLLPGLSDTLAAEQFHAPGAATIIDGQVFKPVVIPATGQWQLCRLESIKSYVLVHPNGRQAWFNDDQINEVRRRHPNIQFTDNPIRDINVMARYGLRPFHVDPDFDPTGLADAPKD